eukprot:SAG31_NODE_5067_length_2761_cov_53.365890_2_plen_286_part_00
MIATRGCTGTAKAISRKHAVLERHVGRADGHETFTCACVGKNSIAINEEIYSAADGPVQIRHGDAILIGPVALYFLADSKPASSPAEVHMAKFAGASSPRQRVQALQVQEKVERLFSSSPALSSSRAQPSPSQPPSEISVSDVLPEWEETLAALHLSGGEVYLMKQPTVTLGRPCKGQMRAHVLIGACASEPRRTASAESLIAEQSPLFCLSIDISGEETETTISRRHAQITCVDVEAWPHAFYVRCLSSRSILINGQLRGSADGATQCKQRLLSLPTVIQSSWC